ncbi:MAG TPA: hypothetical protein VKZ61_14315 [Thermomicrobiales bacterium]|jgi:hypothetical protein|nr:hypothetical protein [Thermomicrobiales bacterium]
MSGMTINAEVASVRPSRLVAEALVNGHDRTQVVRRARAMGISRDMADVVATVCCKCGDSEGEPVRNFSMADDSSNS